MSSNVVIGDWGSTRLRLWRLERGNAAERREGPGIAKLRDPAAALSATLGDWPVDRIILCGMAGAREGLCEAPYVVCPAGSAAWKKHATTCRPGGLEVIIAPGFSSRNDQGRPDVMRGEETQIFGAMALDPALASGRKRILLPGTHSKWVWLEDGSIVEFTTAMTGELFALLEQSSLLGTMPDEGGHDGGFAAGLARAREGGALSATLFEARSAQLVDAKSPGWAAAFASGLLIGSEIVEMRPADKVTLIGDPSLALSYAEALGQVGTEARYLDGEDCAIAGLRLLL